MARMKPECRQIDSDLPCRLSKQGLSTTETNYSIADILSGNADGIGSSLLCKRLPCVKCGGSGTLVCEKCNWKGEAITGVKSIITGCEKCKSSGKQICLGCNGTGKGRLGPIRMENCWTCNGTGKTTCDSCGGTGNVTSSEYVYDRCKACDGSKIISCPVCRSAR